MSFTRQKIDRHLRRNVIKKILAIIIVSIIFIGFMSYALYKEYGPDAEIVDYFEEVN
jgi:hypothetical protein